MRPTILVDIFIIQSQAVGQNHGKHASRSYSDQEADHYVLEAVS